MSEAPSTHLTASQVAERNRRIAADRGAGMGWREIAARYAISERQARRARDEALSFDAAVFAEDPGLLLARVVGAHIKAIDRLSDLVDSRVESVALGAAHRLGVTATGLFDVLDRAGHLPPSPRSWQLLRDGRTLFGAAADQLGVPREDVLRVVGVDPVRALAEPKREVLS
jgi:hypothetical protein